MVKRVRGEQKVEGEIRKKKFGVGKEVVPYMLDADHRVNSLGNSSTKGNSLNEVPWPRTMKSSCESEVREEMGNYNGSLRVIP